MTTSGRRGWGSAVKTAYNGVLYASKLEARYAEHLDWLMDEGRIVRWDGQVRWPLVVNGIRVCLMVPDFRVWLSNSKYELHETKGFQQPLWKLKRKLFEALHPDIPYVVITAKDMASL